MVERFTRIRTADGTDCFAQVHDDGSFQPLSCAPWLGGVATGPRLTNATRLAPVTPSKVLCVGRNYAAHAKELGNEVPKAPLLFLKASTTVIGTGATIELPPQSERVEHEGELAIVIGKTLKNADEATCMAGVFGYTIANDVTARDIQRADVQFTRGKSFDTFCPVGPDIVRGFDPSDVRLHLEVNGETRQDGRTRDMVFSVPTLLSYMSHAMTLCPGDLILTGTPEGVGPLRHGDRVSVHIEGLGTLSNPVLAPA